MSARDRLHLLHVLQTLDPASGGVAAACSRFASEQVKFGREVRVFARHPGPATFNGPPAAESRLAAAVAAADCLHLHGVWDPVVFRAARLARRAGKPYVLTPHGMLDPWCLRQSRLKKVVALRLGYRAMLDRAAVLHALTSDEAGSFRALGLTARVEIVPNGVSLADADPPADVAPFDVPGLGGRPYVLFLGRLHFKKGLDFLGDAFAILARRLPEVHLVVAGPDEGARSDFTRRVAIGGLTARVHVVGPLIGAAKWAALRGAACFCLPSRQEGFSVAVLEAMACGTPVVISPECHFPEVGSHGAGIVVPLDAGALADALAGILVNPPTRMAMGTSARNLVRDRYAWDRVVEQMNVVYEIAVGAKP